MSKRGPDAVEEAVILRRSCRESTDGHRVYAALVPTQRKSPPPVQLEPVTEEFAPRGVTYPRAWNAIIVLSVANLLLAIASGLFLGAVAYANVMRQPAQFQSGAVMLIDQPTAISIGDAGVVVKLNQLRGKYVALVLTSEIMVPAAKRANLPVGVMRVAQRPVFPAQTLTVIPFARAGNPQLAQKIAQATAETLEDYVSVEQAATGLAPPQRISLRIVQNAGPGGKVSPLPSRGRQVGLVAAAAGMLLAYVGLQLTSASRRNI
jgi:hypothetical protein